METYAVNESRFHFFRLFERKKICWISQSSPYLHASIALWIFVVPFVTCVQKPFRWTKKKQKETHTSSENRFQCKRKMHNRIDEWTDGRMNVCVLIFDETLKYQSWTMNEIYSQCELFLLVFFLFRERAHSQDIDRCTLCVVRLVHSKRSPIFIEMVFTLKEISFALRIGLDCFIS